MKCPYKVGETVYLKHVPLSGKDNFIPTNLVNKPLKILSITKIPLNDTELWDLELEGCMYIVSTKNVSRKKPF